MDFLRVVDLECVECSKLFRGNQNKNICRECISFRNGVDKGKKLILDEIESCECMSAISKLLRQYGI